MEGCARKVAALPSIREVRLVAVRSAPRRGWVKRAGRRYEVADVAEGTTMAGDRVYVHLSESPARERVPTT